MGNLDTAKRLIDEGDKESALAFLASTLIENKKDMEAWLLLGELIDDPARKRDCYRQVLKLSPGNAQALTKLQELEEPAPAELPLTVPEDKQPESEHSTNETEPGMRPIPMRSFYSPVKESKSWLEIFAYVVGGIAVFLVLMYVITRPDSLSEDVNNPSNEINNLYIALIFISLIAIMIVLTLSERNRH